MPFLNHLNLRYHQDDKWEVIEDFCYEWPRDDSIVCAEAGFLTDQASVPDLVLPFLVDNTGKITRPAVIHDRLYVDHLGLTKKQVDLMFRDACIEAGMKKWRAWLAWMGVRANLKAAWGWGRV